MKAINRNFILLVMLLISTVLLMFLVVNGSYMKLFTSDTSDKEKIIEIDSEDKKAMANSEGIVLSEAAHSRAAHDSLSQVWKPMGDEASAAKAKLWFASRGNYGFYGPEEQDDYKSYDNATLYRLSDEGDIHAMHILSDRAETIDDSQKILQRAAVYGSTEALAQLATIEKIKKMKGDKSAEEKKAVVLESLAYYEAAEIRGDWWPKIQMGDILIKQEGIEMTQSDRDYISRRGKEIYEELQQGRYSLGLGEFDNSTPDEVMKFYEEMLRPL